MGSDVLFLLDPDDELPGPAGRRVPALALLAGGAGLLIVLLAVHGNTAPVVARPTPSRSPAACAPHVCASTDTPTPAVVAVFRHVLPGSVVVAEHSVASVPAGRGLQRRSIEVVSGNVVIRVLVRPAAEHAQTPKGTVAMEHAGYLIQYRLRGFYPPTRAQLDTLSDDPRLTSPYG